MSEKQQSLLVAIVALIVSAGAITYGALTAQPQAQLSVKPSVSSHPVKTTPKPVTATPAQRLQSELPTIMGVLNSAYPAIATDYTVNPGSLYGDGTWFGTTLSYKGGDTLNRDTLRVLMQKKNNIWTIRTTPPEPLLSAKKYPDVPKSILQSLNKAISLP